MGRLSEYSEEEQRAIKGINPKNWAQQLVDHFYTALKQHISNYLTYEVLSKSDIPFSVPVHELQEIDRVLTRAMNALESDADLEAKCQAFEMIQDLYWPPKIMSKVPREGE